MVRISWPLALLVAVMIAVAARRPRLLVPMLLVFLAWFAWQRLSQRRR